MKVTVRFRLESEIALHRDRYPLVDWNSVVANAIRTKVKMLQQVAGAPTPAVNRDLMPWETAGKASQQQLRSKKSRRSKPAPPSDEEIRRRRELLQSSRATSTAVR